MNKMYFYYLLKTNKLFILICFLTTFGMVYFTQTVIYASEGFKCSTSVHDDQFLLKDLTSQSFSYYFILNIIYSFIYGFIIHPEKKSIWNNLFESHINKHLNYCSGYFFIITIIFFLPLVLALLFSTKLLLLASVWISIFSIILFCFIAFLLGLLFAYNTWIKRMLITFSLLFIIFIFYGNIDSFRMPYSYAYNLLMIFLIIALFISTFYKNKLSKITTAFIISLGLSGFYFLLTLATIVQPKNSIEFKNMYHSLITENPYKSGEFIYHYNFSFNLMTLNPALDYNWLSGSYSNNIKYISKQLKIKAKNIEKHDIALKYKCLNYKKPLRKNYFHPIFSSQHSDMNNLMKFQPFYTTKHTLIFKNKIYKISNNKLTPIWKSIKNEKIIWLNSDEDFQIFGTNNSVIIFSINSSKTHELKLSEKPDFAFIVKSSKKEPYKNEWELKVATENTDYNYSIKNQKVELVNEKPIPYNTITSSIDLIYSLYYLEGFLLYPDLSFYLIPLLVLCLLAAYIYRKDEDKRILMLKIILTFLFGIFMFLSLLWLQRPISNKVLKELNT